MMLSISTTKFLIAELAVADYNFHRWTSKPTEYYSVNSKPTCKPPELHTIMKKCNGTGMVLKICETKNNVWKRHILSIQNSIDNHIKTTRIKPNFASLNRQIVVFKDLQPLILLSFSKTGYRASNKKVILFRKENNFRENHIGEYRLCGSFNL